VSNHRVARAGCAHRSFHRKTRSLEEFSAISHPSRLRVFLFDLRMGASDHRSASDESTPLQLELRAFQTIDSPVPRY